MKKVEFSASNEIPADLLLQIFYNSPVKSLIRFSCVSKLWFHLTINDHQQFNKFHFVESQKKPILIFTFRVAYDIKKFYYLEKEEHDNALKLLPYQKKEIQNKYVIGNVNGLFCYWNLGSRPMCEWVYFSLEVCNPSRVKKLTIVSRLKSRVGQIVYGFRFGYDHLKDEYKVIGILKFKEEYEYYVLTLGGIEHWRQIHNPRPKHRPTKYFESTGRRVVPPISCGGTIFYEIEKDECFTLVSLDLHSEKFQMIKLPCDGDFSNLYPSEYKGCFCYSSVQKINPHKGKVALYMLKDIVTEDWVKEIIEFDLPRELDYPAPPSSTRIMNFPNQVFLYWWVYNEENDHFIQFYNVHSKEFKEIKIPSEGYTDCREYNISSHIENFVSLKILAVMTNEGNTRAMEAYKENPDRVQQLFTGMPTTNPTVISFVGHFYFFLK
ncbi:putative F-box protein At1g47730 [Papaver somniferum]|uniref:putative F-box protein At1g47730 n=1 Tax=Papaver somniferum TaxID=3469 RepID=UPI000E6FE2E8|nr:putative F-box protein At1g47730 [Papaver somniferum]